MKAINDKFTEKEHKRITDIKAKQGGTWREFIIDAAEAWEELNQ